MRAEITYQPESGVFEEVHFELSTVWNSQTFTWVKFENQEYQVWYGSFRGTPYGNLAFSERSGHAIIPTEDGTYIVDINERKLLKFYGAEYQIRSVITVPQTSTFVVASQYEIYRTDKEYELIQIESQVNMDLIRFKSVNHNHIEFDYEEIGIWKQTNVYLNTKTWTIKEID